MRISDWSSDVCSSDLSRVLGQSARRRNSCRDDHRVPNPEPLYLLSRTSAQREDPGPIRCRGGGDPRIGVGTSQADPSVTMYRTSVLLDGMLSDIVERTRNGRPRRAAGARLHAPPP